MRLCHYPELLSHTLTVSLRSYAISYSTSLLSSTLNKGHEGTPLPTFTDTRWLCPCGFCEIFSRQPNLFVSKFVTRASLPVLLFLLQTVSCQPLRGRFIYPGIAYPSHLDRNCTRVHKTLGGPTKC